MRVSAAKAREFGDIGNGFAQVVIGRVKSGSYAVVRYLPEGADIAPEVYGRFESVEAAEPCFERACADVVQMGYAVN